MLYLSPIIYEVTTYNLNPITSPIIAEILHAKNGRAIVVCGFLMK